MSDCVRREILAYGQCEISDFVECEMFVCDEREIMLAGGTRSLDYARDDIERCRKSNCPVERVHGRRFFDKLRMTSVAIGICWLVMGVCF